MTVNENTKGRLESINTMINEKLTTVTSLDAKVLELCEVEEIEAEIEEADEIKSRTLDIKRAVSTVLALKPDDKVSKVKNRINLLKRATNCMGVKGKLQTMFKISHCM